MPRWQKRIEATAFSNPFSFSGPAWNFFLTLHISEGTLNTNLIHYKKCESKCEKYQSKAGSCAYCHCAKRKVFWLRKLKIVKKKHFFRSHIVRESLSNSYYSMLNACTPSFAEARLNIFHFSSS